MKTLYFIGMLIAGILCAFIGNVLAMWAVAMVVKTKFATAISSFMSGDEPEAPSTIQPEPAQ